MSKQYELDEKLQCILATIQEPGREEEEYAPDDEQEQETIHVYPVEGGGMLFSKVPLDQEEPATIDSQEPDTRIPATKHLAAPGKDPFFFPYCLLILCFFLLFDMADSALLAVFTPIVTITITPQVQTITITKTFPLGIDGVQGRVLPVLTVSQSQTTQATGKGHQNARQATGTLTLYNGLFTAQDVPGGTVFTGGDGVQVVTRTSITIPAANPPQFAEGSVSAYAVRAGRTGNIAAGDIDITIANGVLVKNSQFAGGRDARDFISVTKGDIQGSVSSLTSTLLSSERAALSTQLTEGEELVSPTCSPTVTTNHRPGDEASAVQVMVSESCKALAYNQQALQKATTQQLTTKTNTIEKGYHLARAIEVTVLSAQITDQPRGAASIAVTIHGVWVYTINEKQVTTLVSGRLRQQAVHLVSLLPGVHHVTISGGANTDVLPEDTAHIHLLIVFPVSSEGIAP